jgi:cytochrome c oxidase subunit 3
MGTATDSEDEESGLGPPAGWDFPRGLEEASWWPFIGAVGAATLYLGAGLFIIGWTDYSLVPKFLGPLVFGGGAFLLLVGIFGWLHQAFVEPYWDKDESVLDSGVHRLGMLLFVMTDIATFAAGFTYYYFVRIGSWPTEELPHLLTPVLAINTVLLVGSSFTFEYAHKKLSGGDHKRFLAWLGVTLALGLAFVGGQVYEYHEMIVKEGFTIASGLFGPAFFGLTGLHGLHVVTGVILMGILLVRGLMGQFSAGRDTAVRTVSMYWHFVDAIWLVIIMSLYFGATFGA